MGRRFDRFLLLTCFAILIAITFWMTFHFDNQIDDMEEQQCEFAVINVSLATAFLADIPTQELPAASRAAVKNAVDSLEQQCDLAGSDAP